jgi:hydroxyacylglutathione hydrolase
MIFRQITHDDLGRASYLIGDEHAGVAAVVNPDLDAEEYLALARDMNQRVEHVLKTHIHADQVAGRPPPRPGRPPRSLHEHHPPCNVR